MSSFNAVPDKEPGLISRAFSWAIFIALTALAERIVQTHVTYESSPMTGLDGTGWLPSGSCDIQSVADDAAAVIDQCFRTTTPLDVAEPTIKIQE